MSILQNACDTTIHIQESSLTAVGGDQNIQYNRPVAVAAQNFAGNQNIYQGAPLSGMSSSL